MRAMRAAKDAEIAVLCDDDRRAGGLEAAREEIILGVSIPDDEDVVGAEASIGNPIGNV
jgi:hypothetical protein